MTGHELNSRDLVKAWKVVWLWSSTNKVKNLVCTKISSLRSDKMVCQTTLTSPRQMRKLSTSELRTIL